MEKIEKAANLLSQVIGLLPTEIQPFARRFSENPHTTERPPFVRLHKHSGMVYREAEDAAYAAYMACFNHPFADNNDIDLEAVELNVKYATKEK